MEWLLQMQESLTDSKRYSTADSDVVDVSGTTFSKSNIIAELDKVVDAIPSAVYGKEDLKIYLPTSAAKFYVQAQAALGYRDLYHVGKTDEFSRY